MPTMPLSSDAPGVKTRGTKAREKKQLARARGREKQRVQAEAAHAHWLAYQAVVCATKQRYSSGASADAARRRFPEVTRVYLCPVCQQWHLTSQP